MDGEAFRISALAAQQAYERELADLRKASAEGKITVEDLVRLKKSLEDRHNEKLRSLNMAMAGAAFAPHQNG